MATFGYIDGYTERHHMTTEQIPTQDVPLGEQIARAIDAGKTLRPRGPNTDWEMGVQHGLSTAATIARSFAPASESSEDAIASLIAQAKAEAWDERGKARPSYLGPDDGHYDDDCMGWEDCHCASWPNPYRNNANDGAAL